MDFTITTYDTLLKTLQKQGFLFSAFGEFISGASIKTIILRHDVDQLPENSSDFARIEAEKGIKGTYYFRVMPESFDEKIIKQIYEFGHEIGYHYEDLNVAAQRCKDTTVQRQKKGKGLRTHDSGHTEEELAEIAIESFKTNLEKLRQIVPVKTICMHGSPMSKWDSRLLWKYYDYHDFGIVGDPYFDVDFDEVLYLTDTGRRWDGSTVNIRDKGLGIRDEGLEEVFYKDWKVKPAQGSLMNMTPESIDFQNKYKFRSTFDIIKAAEEGRLSDKMMITFHPQRWTDKPVPWVKELVWQNGKNVAKYFIIKWRGQGLGIWD